MWRLLLKIMHFIEVVVLGIISGWNKAGKATKRPRQVVFVVFFIFVVGPIFAIPTIALMLSVLSSGLSYIF